MSPEWSDLKVVLAVARARSVAGAARAMGVDQSTVSRRLAALEDSVGAALVVRGGREVTLTAEGRLLLEAAERVEAIVDEAALALRASKTEVSGTVRITCPPGALRHIITALKAAREKYPQLAYEASGDYRTLDLTKGEADLALRGFRPTEPDLVVRKLVDIGWAVYASRPYQAARGLPATFGELASHALVLYPAAMHSVLGMKWMDNHKGPGTEVMRVDNIELAQQVILAGDGIGVLPSFMVSHYPDVIRVFPDRVAQTTFYCVYHETARNTARVRIAADVIAEYFEANAAMFDGTAT